MNLTGRVYENNKIRTAVTYLNPLDGKQECRDVYVSYKITILDKVGCYLIKHKILRCKILCFTRAVLKQK